MFWMLTTPFVTQIPLPYMAWWHLRNGIMGYWGEAMLKSNFWRKRLMWRPCVLYCDFCPHSASVASLNHNSWWLLKETEQLVGETLLFFFMWNKWSGYENVWPRVLRFLAGGSRAFTNKYGTYTTDKLQFLCFALFECWLYDHW